MKMMNSDKIKLDIIDIRDIEDIVNKDIESGRKTIEEKIKVKIGIIEKCSLEPVPHMVVRIMNPEEGEEKIWLEGPIESFEKGENLSEGKRVEIIAKNIGTIVGECDFGKIDNPLPLYVADYVKVAEDIIGIIKKSSFDEDGIHAIVMVEGEEIFVEGSNFEKGDYKEGVRVKIKGRFTGTIVGDWEFGDLGILPLFSAERVDIV